MKDRPIFIGLSPAGARQDFEVAVLDEFMNVQGLFSAGSLEALALIRTHDQVVMAINSARRPNAGLMGNGDFRRSLSPVPRGKSWMDVRVADYQLGLLGYPPQRAPHDASRAAQVMQQGFALYAALAEDGFDPGALRDGEPRPAKICWETNSQVIFALLLGRLGEPRTHFAGRLQRQLSLRTHKIGVPDPMRIFEEFTRHRILQGKLPIEELLSAGQLDAVAAAYGAWQAYRTPQAISLIGHPEEGQVMVPAKELLSADHYAAL